MKVNILTIILVWCWILSWIFPSENKIASAQAKNLKFLPSCCSTPVNFNHQPAHPQMGQNGFAHPLELFHTFSHIAKYHHFGANYNAIRLTPSIKPWKKCELQHQKINMDKGERWQWPPPTPPSPLVDPSNQQHFKFLIVVYFLPMLVFLQKSSFKFLAMLWWDDRNILKKDNNQLWK